MSGNTYGKLFTVTSAGESHGPALVAIVDGCPPGLELSLEDLQRDLDRRKPGTSRHTTQRQEDDVVEILAGVFEGKTTGCAIGLLIRIPIRSPRITRRSRMSSARPMPITPISTSTASATTVAVAAARLARPPCAWPPAPSPRSTWRPRAS